jgi:hypothetical protein
LFGEPAWDILLDLYAAAEANDLRSIKSACLSSQVPEATALRYIDLPAAHGRVERKPDRTDKRRKYLTPHHRQASARCMITWRRCRRWRPGRGFDPPLAAVVLTGPEVISRSA